MNDINGIRNANIQASLNALNNLQLKADEAQKQNHPQAARFKAEYEALNAELQPELAAVGYKLN